MRVFLKGIGRVYRDYRRMTLGRRTLVKAGMLAVALATGFSLRSVPLPGDLKFQAYLGVLIAGPVIILTGWLLVRLLGANQPSAPPGS